MLKHQSRTKDKEFNRVSIWAVFVKTLSVNMRCRLTPHLSDGGNEKTAYGGFIALILRPFLVRLPSPCNTAAPAHSEQGALPHSGFWAQSTDLL